MPDRKSEILKPFINNQDYMNDKVKAGIEQNRKGYATLKFIDKEGNPVTGVHIELKQKTHDFQFGCSIFLLDELETDEKNHQYKEAFASTFNTAVAPFYWGDLEPEKGKPRYATNSPKVYRRPSPDLVLDFCQKKDIAVKGHCIVYDAFAPKWLPREVSGIKKEIEHHMQELSERYGDKIPQWDVVNEALDWNVYDWGRMTSFFREDDYVDWSFACAKRFFPTQELFINEASGMFGNEFRFNRSNYYMQIEALLKRGVPIDAIGMQFHSFVKMENEAKDAAVRYDPMRTFDALDYFARFNKPLQISEITFPSYNGGEDDEYVQAEILRNMYSMWFSHPSMEAIIYWNLVDGYTYVPAGVTNGKYAGENYYGGGLLRHDMTEKPAFTVLKELIDKTWRTNLTLKTDDSDNATFKGFFGKYDVVVTHDGHKTQTTIHLDKRMDLSHTIIID